MNISFISGATFFSAIYTQSGFLLDTIKTLIISMIPVIELRGALPIATQCYNLPYLYALLLCIVGNVIPVPFIIIFIKKLFALMRKIPFLGKIADFFERLGDKKSETVRKYAFWGLFILVAIPLPGTGAWTGALVASVLNMDNRHAFLPIALGVVGAAVIVSIVTYGAVGIAGLF